MPNSSIPGNDVVKKAVAKTERKAAAETGKKAIPFHNLVDTDVGGAKKDLDFGSDNEENSPSSVVNNNGQAILPFMDQAYCHHKHSERNSGGKSRIGFC